jgi:hypothetical protein
VKESYFLCFALISPFGDRFFLRAGREAVGCDDCAIIIGGCLGMGRDALGRGRNACFDIDF